MGEEGQKAFGSLENFTKKLSEGGELATNSFAEATTTIKKYAGELPEYVSEMTAGVEKGFAAHIEEAFIMAGE
jgi:hypothetical protein